MASTDGTKKIGIVQRIVALIKEITDFNDRVYYGFRTKIDADNGVLVHLIGETRPIEQETTGHAEHYVNLIIMVKMRSNIPIGPNASAETEMDDFIELVGLIVDKLESQWEDDEDNWERLHMPEFDYTYGQDRQFLYHNCEIQVVVRTEY